GRSTGGPFRSISTALPGVQFCELMPKCATINDQFSLIRSMSTGPSEHFEGIDLLVRGELPRPPFPRPGLGSVIARALGNAEAKGRSFCFLDPCPEGNEFQKFKAGDWAGWLGSDYGPVRSGGEFKLKNVDLPEHLSAADHSDREALRSFLSRKFANERKVPSVQSYNS